MSTYRNIHGRSIKAVSTDPSADINEGEIWYNTTSETFKSIIISEAWVSSSPLSTARIQLSGAVSSPNTASLAFGGYTGTASNSTEEYNGSGWAVGGNLSTARYQGAGAGTQTAGLFFGGRPPASGATTTEEYGGASWTSGGALPVAKMGLSGCGLQTAALAFGGSPPTRNTTEEYDGSSWTAGGTLSVAFEDAAGAGTQTAGLKFGGRGAPTQTTEKYDGSSWTTSNNMNTGRGYLGGAGIQTAALGYGGMTLPNTYQTATESYDGTSWTTLSATMGTGIRQFGGTGATNTAALAFGGESAGTATLGTTEEYSKSVNAVTAGAWSSGGNYPGPASSVRGFGTVHSASVAIGGETGPGPTVNVCNQYDGSSWTSAATIPSTARNAFGYGTLTAGLYSGGNTAPGQNPITNASAEWDGSSWTGGPTVPTSRGFGASSGVQTSALSTGGDNGGSPSFASNKVDSYNGSSWTSETDYPGGAYGVTGCGRTETTAFVFGGEAPYPGSNSNVATYNGSAWTTTATPVNTLLPANTQQASSYGQQDDCIAFGGTSSQSATTGWDGTAWSTRPSMGTGRSAGGTGISTDALAFCGSPVPAGGNKTEEFIGETSALNVKTLTQS